MADEIAPVGEVSSSSSSSSSHETHESQSTQNTSSTSESSSTSETSSSSSSSTSSSEKSHEINTSDSTNISNEAHESDEAEDGHSVNMSWLDGEDTKTSEAKGTEGNKDVKETNRTQPSPEVQEQLKQELKEEMNKEIRQIAVEYERSFKGQRTYDIDNGVLEKLDKYSLTNNCANMQSTILDEVGLFDKAEYQKASGCSPDDRCSIFKKHLKEEGYYEVSRDQAQEGDIWVKINSDGTGHTEMVSGRDANGNVTTIGSNNIYDANGKNTHVQGISERTKSLGELNKGVFLHKDFSQEELGQIAEGLKSGEIADYAKEQLNNPSLSSEERANLEQLLNNISDYEANYEMLEKMSNGDFSDYDPDTASMNVSKAGYNPDTASTNASNGATQANETTQVNDSNGLRGDTQKEQAWNYMKDNFGMSDNAIAGIMGNIAQESGYASNNVQNSYEDTVGSDLAYTAGVDNGTISRDDFIHDGAGYGVVQYTWSGYKEGLYDMAQERGTSISDLKTQLDYLSTQISPDLMNKLNSAGSPEEAAVIFEQEFEKAGVPALEERKAYANEAYNQFVNGASESTGLAGAVSSYEPTTSMSASGVSDKATPETNYNTDVKGAGVNYTAEDKEIAAFIDKYIEDKGSPIADQGAGEMMVKYGKEYGVDPMILLSIAQAETGLGTTGIGQDGMLGVGAYDDDPNNATRNPAFSGFETQIRRGAETFDKLRSQAGLTADASLHDQLKAVNEQGWASAKDWYDLVERCYNPIAKKAVNAGIAEMRDGSYVAPSNSINNVSSASPVTNSYSSYPSSGSGYVAPAGGGGYSGYPSSGGGYASPAGGGYSGYPSSAGGYASPAGGASSIPQAGQLQGNSQQEQIWNYLHQLGLNDIAAAGIMGNMAQESGYASNNVQNSYEGKVGNDQAYTAGVDNGSISRDSFAHDGAGYGLVQFTYSGYKEGLYDLAKSRGTSVSDIGTQLDFLASQMNTGLIQRLNSASTPQEAARIFEVEFEKAGTPNMAQREAYAGQAYNQFANA